MQRKVRKSFRKFYSPSLTTLTTMRAISIVLAIFAALLLPLTSHEIKAEECEDITGTQKWGSESHGDNTPSEKKFKQILNDDSKGICDLAKAVDLMEAKGSVRDWSDFKETTVYLGTTDDVQDCLRDRFELPDDDGDEHLADYEIQKCATDSY